MTYLISFFISYLFGSIPTAYFVVRQAADMDIRLTGSGNVGGRNAFEVTGKKWVGIVVVLVDLVKGIAGVLCVMTIYGNEPFLISIAMVGAVGGHCYSAWLGFKGGRGLATAAGIFLFFSWVWVPLWLILYFAVEKFAKNVHVSSVVALLGTPLLLLFVPDGFIEKIIPAYFPVDHFMAAGSAVIAVCLSKHIEPLTKPERGENTNE